MDLSLCIIFRYFRYQIFRCFIQVSRWVFFDRCFYICVLDRYFQIGVLDKCFQIGVLYRCLDGCFQIGVFIQVFQIGHFRQVFLDRCFRQVFSDRCFRQVLLDSQVFLDFFIHIYIQAIKYSFNNDLPGLCCLNKTFCKYLT